MTELSKIQWRAEDSPCPLCDSRKAKVLGVRGGRAHHENKGVETKIVRCLDCHAVYQQPTLLPESNPYSEYSAEEYFYFQQSQEKILYGEKLANFAENILGKPGKMLELGCGRGDLLRGAVNRGWEVRGVEMTESFAVVAQDLKDIEVEFAPIETCNSLKEVYDVVILAAILEHLYEPVKTLKMIRSALQPGGLIFIDVPNECSLSTIVGNSYMRLRGRDWAINLSPTFPPFHVVGFCPTSLRRLLTSVGFRPLSLQLYRLGNLFPGKGISGKIEYIGLDLVQSLGKLIGMGDGIICWAIRE